MVRVKLSFDVETKDYKWELKDSKNNSVIEIESIKGTIYLRNYPHELGFENKNTMEFTLCQSDQVLSRGNKHILTNETVKKYPLTKFIWCQEFTNNYYRCYNPATEKWHEFIKQHLNISLVAIHTDILNYVLKHPLQTDQSVATYAYDRQSVASTFSQIENTIKPIDDKKDK